MQSLNYVLAQSELTELCGARDASCPKGKKMGERFRKICILPMYLCLTKLMSVQESHFALNWTEKWKKYAEFISPKGVFYMRLD